VHILSKVRYERSELIQMLLGVIEDSQNDIVNAWTDTLPTES
jgi:hypothetical protein